jgi:hypothetical protein
MFASKRRGGRDEDATGCTCGLDIMYGALWLPILEMLILDSWT